MVKGISRQVIVVNPRGEELFDQVIFILKDEAVQKGFTDDMLMKQAQQAIRSSGRSGKLKIWQYGPFWACGGAVVTGLAWLITLLI